MNSLAQLPDFDVDFSELEEVEEIRPVLSENLLYRCESMIMRSFFQPEQKVIMLLELHECADNIDLIGWIRFLSDYVEAPVLNGKQLKYRKWYSWPDCQFQMALQKDEFYGCR